MKKILARLTILITLVSLLAGCTPDELAFLQINQELSSMDAYTMTGTINWNTDLEALLEKSSALATDDLESQKEFVQIIEKEGLKHISFNYGVNIKDEEMSASYSAGNNQLFSMIFLDNTYYVNFDGVLEMIKRNDSQALQESELYDNLEILKGKYLAVSMEDLIQGGMSSSDMMMPAQFQSSLIKQQAFQKNVITYFIDYAKTELSGYNTGVMKKTFNSDLNADVYGYSVNLDQTPMMGLDFMMYLLDHIDGTEILVTKIVSDPVILEQTGMDAETATTEVKTVFEELRYDIDATRAQLTEAIAQEKSTSAIATQITSTVGTATVEASLAKLSTKKYWNQVKVTINNPNGLLPIENATLDATVTMDGSKTPSIQKPSNILLFNTFNETMPHILTLEPDYDSATYEAGFLGTQYLDADMKNVDGHWYISMGSIPERFRKLIVSDGSQLSIGGKVLTAPNDKFSEGDITYIAVGAFKNAGINVTWDDEYRTLTLDN